MKLSVERMPESQVLLDIAADEDEFAKAMERAVRKVSRQLNVPGFRRGKAPRYVIEQMYGREVFLDEAQSDVMEDLYKRALEQEKLVPVGPPQVDVVTPEPVGFRVVVPVYPTVNPGPYTDARVEPIDAAVDDAEVEEVVDRMRQARATWVPPAESRAPRAGDQVTIDLAVTEGDEPFQDPATDAKFVLGESNLFDALREQIEQMNVGETTTLDLAFDDEDETVAEGLRGKALSYTITLNALNERDLPALDDEFAQAAAEMSTMEELRTAIHDDLHRRKTTDARNEVMSQAINAMAETAPFDLPAVMVDEQVDTEIKELQGRLLNQGLGFAEYLRLKEQTEDELREELRPAVVRRLRNSLLMREIAEREGIAVSDEDLEAEIASLAGDADAENHDRIEAFYRNDYFSNLLRGDLFERRIADRLIKIATDGRGAAINAWVEPEPTETDDDELGTAESAQATPAIIEGEWVEASTAGMSDDDAANEAVSASPPEPSALEQAPTTGTMSGQPGDIAAVAPDADDAAVTVAAVAAEPDPAQAAAIGHTAENAAVASEASEDAVTPEEREARGGPGAGGVLADPET